MNGRAPASWPHRVGVVPPLVPARLTRAIDSELENALSIGTDECQVLSGLGGVGKTQVAAGLAERLWQRGKIDLLVWVNASSRAAVLVRYAQAASEITGIDYANPQAGADRFLAWLTTTSSRWLVILDDLYVPTNLSGLWPPRSRSGHTIVTTRRRDAALLGGRRGTDVDVFTAEESVACLRRKLGDRQGRLEQVELLAEDLGGLPLALTQAAAYMVDQDLGCADYRRRLMRRRLAVLAPDTLPDDQSTTVAETWALSIELAERSEPPGLARPVLELAALLDPNAIPSAIFRSDAIKQYVTGRLGRSIDLEDTHDAIRLLARLSLLTSDVDETVQVHALVQRVVREGVESVVLRIAAQAVADGLSEIWPSVESASTRSQLLRGNAMVLYKYAGDYLVGADGGGCHPLLIRIGQSLGNAGLLRDAFDYFRSLEALASRHLANDHPDVLALRAEIADLEGYIGDRAVAVAAMEEVLASRVRVLGGDHPDTLKTRHDLAHWIGHGGNPAQAIAGIEAVIADMVRAIGQDHPLTLLARGNLAHWRGETGDVTGTVAEMESLLLDRIRVLGPEHPRTLVIRMSLAFWRGRAGDPVRALAELDSLLEDQVRVFGTTHPDVFATRSNIAYWRGQSGDVQGAMDAFRTLVADRIVVLGQEHPRTMLARGNLAHWIGRSGDHAGAVAMLEELVTDQRRLLGPTHRDTMGMRASLAYWRGHAEDTVEAILDLKAIFAEQVRLLGKDHADTCATRLALNYWIARSTGRSEPGLSTIAVEVTGRCRHVSE